MFRYKNTNWIRKGLAVLGVLALLVMPGACAQTEHDWTHIPSGTAFPVEVVDYLGRQVKIAQEPLRIISLAPSNTEIIYALGLEDRLVGVTDICDYPPEAASKEKVGSYNSIDLEKVVSLNPDLILAEDIHKTEIVPALERLGIACYVLVPHNLEEIMHSILVIGRLTGVNTAAQEVVSDMRLHIKNIVDKTSVLADEQRPSIMYVVWHEPIMSVGINTPIHDMITMAGGASIIKVISGWPTLSLEDVIAASPEIIIANVESYPGGDVSLVAILDEVRLRTVRAVVNGKVYGINASLTNRSSPRIIQGLEWFAALIHPELFPELVEQYGEWLN